MRPIRFLLALPALCVAIAAQDTAPTAPSTTPSTRFSGRTLDTRGRPLADVEVRILDPWTPAVGDVLMRTGADGRFAIDVPTTSADTSFEPGWASAVLFSRRGKTSVAVQPSTPWSDAPVDCDVVLPAGVSMRGFVRDTEGQPIAGARVVAREATSFRRWALGPGGFGMFETSPIPTALATSGDDGGFELRGVLPTGMRLEARCDGYANATTPPVGVGDALVLVLGHTGFARGTLVDAAGAPCAGHVVVLFEDGRADHRPVRDDGQFAVPLRSTADYAVFAANMDGGPPEVRADQWHSGPIDDLRIVAPSPGTAESATSPSDAVGDETFELRIVDATTGAPIPGARGGVLWQEALIEAAIPLSQLMSWGVTVDGDADGRVRARRPTPDEDRKGLAIVTAPGHVPMQVAVTWDEKQPHAELRLAVGAAIAGKVVDAVTGAPMAGVRVFALPAAQQVALGTVRVAAFDEDAAALADAATTAADGTFRIDGLASGSLLVRAVPDSRPSSEDTALKVTAGETTADVELRIPRGVAVRGAVRGLPSFEGVRLGLLRGELAETDQPFVGIARFGGIDAGPAPQYQTVLDRDGKFVFDGVAPGAWSVVVTVPSPQLGPRAARIPVGKLDVAREDLEREFDASAARPARVSGRIVVDGAELPPGRLVIESRPAFEDQQVFVMGPFVERGARAYAELDGAFDLTLQAGRVELIVIDTLTDIELGGTGTLELTAGQQLRQDVPIRIGVVRVTIESEDGFRGRFLEAHPTEPRGALVPGMGGPMRVSQGSGLPLAGAPDVVLLHLPTESLELNFWAQRRPSVAEFYTWLDAEGGKPTATETVRAVPGKVVDVTFRAPRGQ